MNAKVLEPATGTGKFYTDTWLDKVIPHTGPLPESLSMAVPVWVHQFKSASWDELQPTMAQAAGALFAKSEALVRASSGEKIISKTGDIADGFNALAQAIAILSFCPGGVNAFGRHWESRFTER